jgi:hypothetical protein
MFSEHMRLAWDWKQNVRLALWARDDVECSPYGSGYLFADRLSRDSPSVPPLRVVSLCGRPVGSPMRCDSFR